MFLKFAREYFNTPDQLILIQHFFRFNLQNPFTLFLRMFHGLPEQNISRQTAMSFGTASPPLRQFVCLNLLFANLSSPIFLFSKKHCTCKLELMQHGIPLITPTVTIQ